MYFIAVAIYGLNQLKKLRKDTIVALSKELDDVGHAMGSKLSKEENRYRIYMIDSSYKESFYVALQMLISIDKVMQGFKANLNGYNSVLFEGEDENPNYREHLYALKKDNHAWIASKLTPLIGSWIKTKPYGIVSLIEDVESNKEDNKAICHYFLYQNSFIKRLKECFQYIENGENVSLNFYSKDGFGKRHTIHHFMSEYSNIEFLWLKGNKDGNNSTLGFTRALSKNLLKKVETQIESNTKPIVKHATDLLRLLLNGLPMIISKKYLIRDLEILYNIYLIIYKKQFLGSNISPFIVIENSTLIDSSCQELLGLILKMCYKEKILVIYLDNEPITSSLTKMVDFASRSYINTKDFGDKNFFKNLNLDEAVPHAIVLCYWLYKNYDQLVYLTLTMENTLKFFAKNIDTFSRKILYTIALCKGMLSKDELIEIIILLKIDKVTIVQRLNSFYEIEILENSEYPQLCYSELSKYLEDNLQEDASNILIDLSKRLYVGLKEGKSFDRFFIFKLLEKSGQVDDAINLLQVYLQYEINFNPINKELLANYHFFPGYTLANEQQINLDLVLINAQLYNQIINPTNDINPKNIINNTVINSDTQNPNFYFWLLTCSKFYNSKDPDSLPEYKIKDILYQFQRQPDKTGEMMTSTQMAYSLFKDGLINQAIDYTEINEKLCESHKNFYGLIQNYRIKICCLMANGNLPLAIKTTEKGIALSSKMLMRDKQIFFLFAKARIYFECSFYDEALNELEEAIRISKLYGKNKPLMVLDNWCGRIYSYLGQYDKAIKFLENPKTEEGAYFLSEYYFLQNEVTRAYLTINIKNDYDKDIIDFEFSEKESWNDGFTILEGGINNLYSEINLLTKLIYYFNLYLKGLCDNKAEVLEFFARYDFNRFIAEEPFSYLYLQYYVNLLSENEHKEIRIIVQNKVDRIINSRINNFSDANLQKGFLKHKRNYCK